MEYFVAFNNNVPFVLCSESPVLGRLNRSAMPSPYFEAPVFDPVHRPAKKRATTPTKEMYSSKPN